MDEIDNKLLNIFELSIINKKKDNVIKSLSGNVEYLREEKKMTKILDFEFYSSVRYKYRYG